MKKKVYTFVIFGILFLGITNLTFAQQWKEYLTPKKEGTYTLFDYQKAFEDYSKNYKLTHSKNSLIDPENKEFGIPGYSQFKRWEWYWETRVDQKNGEFPDKTAWEVWQDYKKNNNIKSVGGTWTSRGDAVLDPIDGGSIQESGTGRINCAHFDPNDDNHFWVGSPAGGLWETTDGGASWSCLTDANPVLGVSDIAIPSDYDETNNPTIFIATGDRDAGDDPSIGILKTTDGGATWVQTGLTFKAKSSVKIGRIIINPNDKNIMWAATSLGIYKSTDAGDNWTFKQGGNFIDMELFPGTTNAGGDGVLLAGTYGFEPKVYRSADGAENWDVAYDASSYAGTQYRMDVAVTFADNDVAYFIMADYDNSMAFEALFRTSNQGLTWTEVYNQGDNNLYGWSENNSAASGGQGWYDVAFAVSNTDENVVYVGGVNAFISTNGGNNFSICNEWDNSAGGNADIVHADHHNAYFVMQSGGADRLFDCNDGGFYYCDNYTQAGNSDWNAITDGLVTGQLYDIGLAQDVVNECISGFQDNGTKLVKNASTDFDQVIGGDGMCCAINPTDNNIQYGTYAQTRVYKSTNDGGSFSIIRDAGDADWAGPVEADPQGGEVIIGDEYVKQYKGTNKNWNTLSQSLDGSNYLKVLDVYNDGTDMVIWAASPNGCWKSPVNSTASGNYTAINGLPGDQVTDIAIDEDDYNHVYLCFGGFDNTNVWETTDGGQNWIDISDGLPAVPCGAIVINEQNNAKHEVYVGTDAGIYVKLGDAPWQLFNDGMPLVSITDLEIYYDNATPDNTRIYASTYGRGVWSSDCYDPPTLDAAISAVNVPLDEYCSSGNITPSVKLSNIGTTALTSATVSYTIDGGAAVSINWNGNLAQGETTNIDFSSISINYGTHDFEATVSSPNGGTDDNLDNDKITKTFSVWDNSLPYTQTFDDFTPNIGYAGSAVVLEQCWVNDDGESNLDWSVTQGATPSSSTGPSGDHTGDGRYLYMETSGAGENITANLLSPVFDLTNYVNSTVTFWYHMLGNEIGTIQVDLYYNGSWHNAVTTSWDGNDASSLSGDQGDQWYQATVDANAASGYADFQVRISATTGTAQNTSYYQSDFAIDDFNVSGVSACTQPTTQASNMSFSNVTDNSITVNWTQGNGDADLVVAREGSAVNQDPTSGTTYTANSTFSSGDEIGTGNYVVYDGTAETVNVTGLTSGTTYHFAIYTYNAADHCYNVTELTGNTTTLGPPSVTTDVTSSITGSSATSGGNVTSDNGATVTARGVCWNTSGSPTTADNKTTDGSGTGTFTSNITGLSGTTTYYVRAYATNSYGTSYGNEETFTTDCGIISSFPWTEDFENGGNRPDCWSEDYISGDNVDWAYGAGNGSSNPSSAHGGSYNAYFKDSDSDVDETDLITPTFDFSSYSDAEMSFWLYNEDWSGDQDELTIYYKTSSSGAWTQIATYNTSVNSWTQYTVALPNLSADYSIAFRGNALYGYGVCIDDINIDGTLANTAISWTGNSDSNWQNTGNWDGGVVPTSSDDVTIPSGAPNYPIINNGISTVAICNNLTIDNGANVVIDSDGYLTVSGSITNNAGTSGLVINSNATGTGSLIHNTSGGVDATVNTYLAGTRQWHFVGSPISNASGVFPSSTNLYTYDETADDYWTGDNYDSSETGWTSFANGAMTVNQGYLYNVSSETTLNYVGTLNDNTSSSSINIVYTDHGGTAANGTDYNDFDGWNFIANPYTSAIDWEDAGINHAAANLDDAMYIYDDVNSQYIVWLNGSTTNGGTQYIPAGQGFFVKANAAGTLDIPSSALTHSTQAYWKSETPNNFLKLQVVGNGYSDETIVRFDANATEGHDSKFDAYKMFSHESNVFQIYTKDINESEKAINTLPEISGLGTKVTVPIRLLNTPDNFVIRASEFNFDGIKVYLKDNELETLIEINLNSEFNLTNSEEGSYDRFELVFEKTATNLSKLENQISIYPNPNKGNFNIVISDNERSYTVEVTNTIGQIVYLNNFTNNTNLINLENKSAGVYFVKIKFDDNYIVSKKIIIE